MMFTRIYLRPTTSGLDLSGPQLRVMSEAWWQEGSHPIFSLEITISLTSIIQQIIPNLHISISEKYVHQSIWRWANYMNQEDILGESNKGAAIHTRTPCRTKGRRELCGRFLALWSPKQSCLSDQHIPCSGAQGSGQRAGQRLSTEGW